jgi:hypothetical protein
MITLADELVEIFKIHQYGPVIVAHRQRLGGRVVDDPELGPQHGDGGSVRRGKDRLPAPGSQLPGEAPILQVQAHVEGHPGITGGGQSQPGIVEQVQAHLTAKVEQTFTAVRDSQHIARAHILLLDHLGQVLRILAQLDDIIDPADGTDDAGYRNFPIASG